MNRVTSTSARRTQEIARAFTTRLYRKRKQGIVVLLSGELGAGKTVFARGILRALGVKNKISSPTFLLIRRFPSPKKKRDVYHIDCYRLRKVDPTIRRELLRIFSNRENIVVIEWAERLKRLVPRRARTIRFHHGKKQNERVIIMP